MLSRLARESSPSWARRRAPPWVKRAIWAADYRLHRRHGEALFRRNVRATDLFVVGHPKSGNTWIGYMLAQILSGEEADEVTLGNLQRWFLHIHSHDFFLTTFRDFPAPRVFRNETPLYPDLYPNTVYLVRHPLAVVTSFYHHYRIDTGDGTTTLDDFVEEYLERGIPSWQPDVERWDRQVLAWLARRERGQRVLFVKYEDMQADREGVLRQVLSFADISASEDAVERAVARGSFDYMRADEDRNGVEYFQGGYRERGRFMREGRTDSWREELSPQAAEKLRIAFKEATVALGYR